MSNARPLGAVQPWTQVTALNPWQNVSTRAPPLLPAEKAGAGQPLYFPVSDSPGKTYYQPLVLLVVGGVLC